MTSQRCFFGFFNHDLFVGDLIRDVEHRIRAASMHPERATYPEGIRAFADDPTVEVYVVGDPLHGCAGSGRAGAPVNRKVEVLCEAVDDRVFERDYGLNL